MLVGHAVGCYSSMLAILPASLTLSSSNIYLLNVLMLIENFSFQSYLNILCVLATHKSSAVTYKSLRAKKNQTSPNDHILAPQTY